MVEWLTTRTCGSRTSPATTPWTGCDGTTSDAPFTGAVRYIAPNIRTATRDLVIEAFCPNPELKLKPGMFAVARLETQEKKVAAIPANAVVKDAETAKAFAVVNKRIEERFVQLGSERDGKVAVLAGLKPGDSVVVAPGPDVHDGVQVQ